MNTINKIVKDTVPPKIELDRVGYDALWLDVSDDANPTLKVKSGNEYKETNGAASVSITVTDPQTGEPVIVTGLANVLNALAEGAGGGGAPVKLTAPELTNYGFLSQVRERINDGLLFNTIIVYSERTQSLPPGPKESVEYLPVSFNEVRQEVRIARGYDPKAFIVPDYTATQFEGVAAIQEAEGSLALVYLITGVADPEGSEEQEYKYLMEDNLGEYICVDGYLLEIGTSEVEDGEVVASITKSSLQPVEGADFVNITMEDAQKLIGIPINRV